MTPACLHRLTELPVHDVQYILRTENPEKVPNIAACRAGTASAACGPGFFDAAMPVLAGDLAGSLIRHKYTAIRTSGGGGGIDSGGGGGGGSLGNGWMREVVEVPAQEPHPCCEGYFCPPALTCMMPCPLGALCRR